MLSHATHATVIFSGQWLMLAADCQQFCVAVPLTKCNCTCVSANQKASGSEAVTEAGCKDASAVTKAGQYFLRVSASSSTMFKCFTIQTRFSLWQSCMLSHYSKTTIWHVELRVIAHSADDSVAKSQKATGGEAAKDTASEGAAAAKNAASKGAGAAKDAASEGAKLASKAGM